MQVYKVECYAYIDIYIAYKIILFLLLSATDIYLLYYYIYITYYVRFNLF
jgi:hypothetical protein